jgi:diguanylate cyclase (GGDEF)-like protein/PAS domain S-box-containing protein
MPEGWVVLTALCAVVFALAARFPLPFAWQVRLHLDTTVILAAALIFDPGVAVAIVVVGAILAQVLRRDSAAEAIFNTAQWGLQAAIAGLIVAFAGWDPYAPTFNQPAMFAAIIVAGIAIHLVNTLAVAFIIGLEGRVSPLWIWYQSTTNFDWAEAAVQFGQVGVAILAAVIADAHVWALSLLLLPVVGMYGSLTHHAKLRRNVEERLRGTEANLAEAQRLSHLGSWEWNLETNARLWSSEAYRILGLEQGAVEPERDIFTEAIHPDDAAHVQDAIGRALRGAGPASIDHQIVRPDGTERYVHSQVEVIFDTEGRPLRALGTLHDITDRKRLEDRLSYQAFHDALTGLPNRALFTDRLEHALARTQRQFGGLAVLFLDLDHFKLVNDTLGHEAGDQLLIAVAERIRACVRPSDTVARLGGDEFTILLEDLEGPYEAEQIAERITQLLGEPFAVIGHDLFVTTSIGIVLQGQSHTSPEDMLRDADVALYRAKDAGRARYAIYDVAMGTAMRERVALESDLRRAIDRAELSLNYQPHVDLISGAVVGVEAFLRWVHPERGPVSPAQFLPIAEETGLIGTLDLWVLDTACRQARVWHAQHPVPLSISVNISGRQLGRPELVRNIGRVLRDAGLHPRALKLEITEIAAMADAEATNEALGQLRDLGVQVVIDDFGTGYSSLVHLKRFPIDTLKLDGSIVAGLGRDVEANAVARAVVGLAHSLNMKVIAEGIESVEQFHYLRGLGCEFGQGNYFSKPLTGEAMTLFLSTAHPALDEFGETLLQTG